MPVTTGTRLERLRDLRRQVDLAIEVEERTAHTHVPADEPRPLGLPRPVTMQPILSGDADVAAVVAHLGVSHAEIRAWARRSGLEVNVRGKLRADIVEAYRDMRLVADTPGGAAAALSRCRVLHVDLRDKLRPCRYCRTFYGDATA